MLKKIDAMQMRYGTKEDQKCRDCCNLIYRSRHGRKYSKCTAYGLSHCTATDWSRYHSACGLFGTDFDGLKAKPLMEYLKNLPAEKEPDVMAGQLSLF